MDVYARISNSNPHFTTLSIHVGVLHGEHE